MPAVARTGIASFTDTISAARGAAPARPDEVLSTGGSSVDATVSDPAVAGAVWPDGWSTRLKEWMRMAVCRTGPSLELIGTVLAPITVYYLHQRAGPRTQEQAKQGAPQPRAWRALSLSTMLVPPGLRISTAAVTYSHGPSGAGTPHLGMLSAAGRTLLQGHRNLAVTGPAASAATLDRAASHLRGGPFS